MTLRQKYPKDKHTIYFISLKYIRFIDYPPSGRSIFMYYSKMSKSNVKSYKNNENRIKHIKSLIK